MKTSNIRSLNMYWAIISIPIVLGITLGSYFIFKKHEWIFYFMISIILNFSVFWCFYLIATSFKKRKYPYLTYIPMYNPSKHILSLLETAKWFWVLLLPTILAIIIPAVVLSVQYVYDSTTITLISFFPHILCIVLSILNNVAYCIILAKIQNGNVDYGDEFLIKNN